jgi:multisubunit Na+/H+ antiporter MnhG subunit
MLEPSTSTYFLSNVESISASFNLIGLVIAGAALVAIFKLTPLLHSLSALTKLKPKYIGVIVVGIWIIAFTAVILKSWGVYQVQNAILANEAQVISGCITDHKTVKSNSREETFFVSGVKFQYNDYATKRYFFANREHETFIQNGQCVTIVYLSKYGNGILKIDKV